MSDYIYDVHHLVRDTDGSICCRCPHCQDVIGIEGQRFSEVRGEQYQCRCNGWLQVDSDAVVIDEADELPANIGVPDDDQ